MLLLHIVKVKSYLYQFPVIEYRRPNGWFDCVAILPFCITNHWLEVRVKVDPNGYRCGGQPKKGGTESV